MMDVDKDQPSTRMFKSSIEPKVESQYLCQFTMLLMDTVEELTVRVSQIDFVCRQHFPDLQTLSQSIQKKILGSNKYEEIEWKKKEDYLLNRIHELESESQHSQEQINQINASLEEAKEKLMIKEQLLKRCECEKKEFLEQLVQKVNEAVKAKEIEEDLLQQIELKDKKIEVEMSKKKSSFEEFNKIKTNYKQLKSQYNFLLTKFGNGIANSPHSDIVEGEKGTSTGCWNKKCTEDMKNGMEEIALHPSQISKSKIDNVNLPMKQGLTPPPKPPLNAKKAPEVSPRPPALRWRDTRARHELKAGDPHDDFLDTPTENARNLGSRRAEENVDPADGCADGDCSDEDAFPENASRRPVLSAIGTKKRKFKYVEAVRRKVERENLKGVECQQCKKFYDAVLPGGGEGAPAAVRCEHHDGISRHRYRYAPPLTPEGFWNIGFDSDL